MPRGFSENQMQLLREKLINAASSALVNTGVRKTTVEDLAKSAGISTGAFYKFFASKETLFFAIYDRAEEELKADFIRRLDASAELSSAAIRGAIQQLLRSEEMQTLLRLLQKDELDYLLRGIDSEILQVHLQKDTAYLQQVIEKLSLHGWIVNAEIPLILSYLQALFVLCAAREQYEPYAGQIIDAFVDTLVDRLLSQPNGQAQPWQTSTLQKSSTH